MKLRGGYDILLEGRPSASVEVLPEPDVLYLPLRSRRFAFRQLCVKEGQRVVAGQAVARDPDNYSVPLLAPLAGTVRLEVAEGHVVLDELASLAEGPEHPLSDVPHVPEDLNLGSMGMKRYKLLALGAWQFTSDAHTGALPDPFGTPRAVIASALRLEPFGARGDVQLSKRLSPLIRGLEQLQGLLEYQPIYLVVPDISSELADRVHEAIRGYAWVKLVQTPLRYPFDNFATLARWLGFKQDGDGPVWAIRTEGMLAFDRALTLSQSCTVRIVSLGGPKVVSPVHFKAMVGYPIESILAGRIKDGEVRVIDGGVLTGQTLDPQQKGLQAECYGLNVLAEQTDREMLGFVRPGGDRRSYSKCFTSALRPARPEPLTTGLRGEKRPCIACGFCEEVCPAGIMPNLIHKLLYADDLEQLDLVGLDLCVACGLCSHLCPSKIELLEGILEARETVQRELHGIDGTEESASDRPAGEVVA